MKVLYFHQHFSTPMGFTGTRSYEMALRLLERGHQVVMVCGSYGESNTGLTGEFVRGGRRGTVDGIDLIEFDLPYSNNDGFMRRAITFIRFALNSIYVALTERYDLIFATSTPLTAGIPGIIARHVRRKPFVFEVRDLWPELPRAMGVITNPIILWAMSVLEWTSYRSADHLIGLSPGIVKGIESHGVATEKIAMIPNGCDLNIFSPTQKPLRPRGISNQDLMAVFAGAHGIANGLDAALDAARELKRRGRTDVKLCFIGRGKLKEDLVNCAINEELNNCIFMNSVSKVELARYFEAADIGMQLLKNIPAFYYGTSPNKFFDYIAAGLPVLNNYPGWLAGIINEHKCGYAVQPDDPKAFANALEHAADNPSYLRTMGNNSYNLAVQQFDRNELADQFAIWLEDTAR